MRPILLGSVIVVGVVSALLVGASIAAAAKPERSPFLASPTVHGVDPGTLHICAFPVELSQLPGSNYALTLFNGGVRLQITGSGFDRAVNWSDRSKSVTVPTSGKLTQTVLPNDDLRVQASGRTLFYFYEGDQGPFGTVGVDGALYYIVGHVDETLDPDAGFAVTSFQWSGRATELCSLID